MHLKEICLNDWLEYIESISANPEAKKIIIPWTMVIACTIGGLIIGLVVNSILTHREKEKSQQNL